MPCSRDLAKPPAIGRMNERWVLRMSGLRRALTAGIGVGAAAPMGAGVSQVSAATAVTLYASPTGSGTTCSQASPCSLSGAQSAVRSQLAATSGADGTVLLQNGTYRLASTWAFGAADSGTPGIRSVGGGRRGLIR